jgi:membrane-bound metal-dependent hydrolase YbcI (DUF457 family)
VKALTHSIFAFIFCVVIYHICVPGIAANRSLVLISGTVALILGPLPDLDARTSLKFIGHRSGISHSIFTVVLFSGLAYVLLSNYPPLDLIIIPAVIGAITSHILLDALTISGCPLFWPFMRHRVSARLCRYDNRVVNTAIIVLSLFAILVFVLYG